jgi:hypothetical protein
MSFEYDDTTKLDDHSANNSATYAANLFPGISLPSNLSNSTYESDIADLKKNVDSYKDEIANMSEKMDVMHTMIQAIMSLINTSRSSQGDAQQPESATRRTK